LRTIEGRESHGRQEIPGAESEVASEVASEKAS
jgi:hypothetical protein